MNGTTKHKDGNGPQQTDLRHFDLRRLIALVTKESYQALRDPSTLLIAFVLPVVLLLLFAYAVSLDAKDVRVGVVLESPGAAAQELAAAFAGTKFLDAHFAHDRREVADQLVSGDLRGYVVIPQDFEQRLAQRGSEPLVQIVTDGSYPNTANYVENYADTDILRIQRHCIGEQQQQHHRQHERDQQCRGVAQRLVAFLGDQGHQAPQVKTAQVGLQ